jgi:hypothetical protein
MCGNDQHSCAATDQKWSVRQLISVSIDHWRGCRRRKLGTSRSTSVPAGASGVAPPLDLGGFLTRWAASRDAWGRRDFGPTLGCRFSALSMGFRRRKLGSSRSTSAVVDASVLVRSLNLGDFFTRSASSGVGWRQDFEPTLGWCSWPPSMGNRACAGSIVDSVRSTAFRSMARLATSVPPATPVPSQ